MSDPRIGIDIGGSNLRAAVVDATGSISRSVKRAVGGREPEAILADLASMLEELAPPAGSPMGVGFPALLRVPEGIVVNAPNLGWQSVPLRALLEARFGRRVRLVNDLDAITAGEAAMGAARGARHVVCVFVGTGVGMGALVDGRLLEGLHGLATELGHTKIDRSASARLCGCGERGCLEAYVSGRHLPDIVLGCVAAGASTSLIDGPADVARLDAGRIEAAALAKDGVALEVWATVARTLGTAIGNLVTLFNPEVVVLGGGVLEAAPGLRARVAADLRACAARPHLEDLRVVDSVLGDDAGLIGAAMLAS